MICGSLGFKNASGQPCGQVVNADRRAPCKFHEAGSTIGRIGVEAQRAQRAAAVYINLSSRRTIERTLQSVARAMADSLLNDKRGNVIVRAAAERIRMLDMRLAEREQDVAEAEAGG